MTIRLYFLSLINQINRSVFFVLKVKKRLLLTWTIGIIICLPPFLYALLLAQLFNLLSMNH